MFKESVSIYEEVLKKSGLYKNLEYVREEVDKYDKEVKKRGKQKIIWKVQVLLLSYSIFYIVSPSINLGICDIMIGIGTQGRVCRVESPQLSVTLFSQDWVIFL